jgi:catechol 2,3-dioxygenase-like lactoylglutathione lyase family enzyme
LKNRWPFYRDALAPLGLKIIHQADDFAMIGGPDGMLVLSAAAPATSPLHIALRANSREAVQQFHAAALRAGGADNGGPGIREKYSPDYYAAFALDPDGHNIEAVTRATV